MKNTKETNKAIAREQFFRIARIVEGAVKAKTAYRENLAAIGKLSSDYKDEYIAARKNGALAEYRAKNQALYDDATAQLEKLQGALSELHGSLDLANPALTNALKLIELSGKDLGHENVMKINAQFAGDQSSLQLLRTAYQARGLNDGGLDKVIYNADDAITELKRCVQAALLQDGSINAMNSAAAKFAKLEGHGDLFAETPDNDGFVDSMRRGAGLPINE